MSHFTESQYDKSRESLAGGPGDETLGSDDPILSAWQDNHTGAWHDGETGRIVTPAVALKLRGENYNPRHAFKCRCSDCLEDMKDVQNYLEREEA